MVKIILCGCNGKMGAAVQNFVKEREDCSIAAGVDVAGAGDGSFPLYASLEEVKEEAQVVVDFSHPAPCPPSWSTAAGTPAPPPCCAPPVTPPSKPRRSGRPPGSFPCSTPEHVFRGKLLIELAKKAEAVLGDAFDVEIVEMPTTRRSTLQRHRPDDRRRHQPGAGGLHAVCVRPALPAEEAGEAGDRPFTLCGAEPLWGNTR